jgi:peroxiredoxin
MRAFYVNSAANSAKIESMATGASPLQDQLDEITSTTRRLVQADRLRVSEQASEELFASGIEDRILAVGSEAPDFTLENFDGKAIHLDDMLSFGPVVVKFFRGRWDPYCVTELEAWRNLYAELRSRGVLLAAISPQAPRQNDFMVGHHLLPFPVLSDHGCRLATQFGLTWTVPDPLRSYYLSVMVNIPYINEEESWTLPMPGTFVIAADRKVLFAEAHADSRVRPEPAEVLACLPGSPR